MNDNVLIKGNQYGISIQMNINATFQQIADELKEKLNKGRAFFGNTSVVLSFTGKKLDQKETENLLQLFKDGSDLDIIAVNESGHNIKDIEEALLDRFGSELRAQVKKEMEEEYSSLLTKLKDEHKSELERQEFKQQQILSDLRKARAVLSENQSNENDSVLYHFSNLRSGQQVITTKDVIIIGDVNNGARVESGGKVIIIGKLKGVVHAGLKRPNKCFVFSLDMKPVQIRIGNTFGRSADDNTNFGASYEPQIAFVENDHIVIETIHNKTYRELSNSLK